MIPALEALRIGLVEEVVAPDQLLARGEQIAGVIAGQAPLAVEKCLEAVHAGYDMPLRQALDLEASLFGLCCATEDKAEGTKAFLEKRQAAWKGR
jgi:enoyl-CoA hydratase